MYSPSNTSGMKFALEDGSRRRYDPRICSVLPLNACHLDTSDQYKLKSREVEARSSCHTGKHPATWLERH